MVIRAARELPTYTDVLDAERLASGWLGDAWSAASLGDREPEKTLCLEVADRASTNPSPHGLAAVSALRRVAPESEHPLLDETIDLLTASQPPPQWSASPAFDAVRAWRAVDVYDSERVLFIEHTSGDPAASDHTLVAQILEAGGTVVAKLGVLRLGAAQSWESMREEGAPPMPIVEVPVAEALADLAGSMRLSDLLWPRNDDESFVDLRALAWARCRAHLPAWPDVQPSADAERDELVEDFIAETGDGELSEVDVVRSLAGLFLDFGDGYLHDRPLGWSPDTVALFLTDWLPRKAVLDGAERQALPEVLRRWLRFALVRRGVADEWITPVVDAVDVWLPDFEAAFDNEESWGPAKQVAAELAGRGIDLNDRDAVDNAIRALNAERLARRLTDS